MQFLSFQLCDFTTGAAIPNGKCFVYLAGTSTLASLFNSSAGSIANPAIASGVAQVGFAAADGVYDLQPAYPDGTPAGPKILSVQIANIVPLVVLKGAKGNDTADDAPAFMSVIADQKASAVTGYQYGNASFRSAVPKGSPAYRLASTIDVDIAARFEAEGTGYGAGIWASLLHPDAGVTAIRIQSDVTTGESGTRAGTLFTGNGVMFIGFGVIGRYNGTTNLEVTTGGHAFHLRASATLRDGGISDMQGDGVHIHAGVATTGFIGNANGWLVERFFIQNCTNGISTNYSDSNAGLATMVFASGCREWGFKNNSGAGNVYLACGAQLCGVSGVGTTAKPSACCHKTGHHYAVRVGQEAGASTNPPTGDSNSNTWWVHFETGGIVNPGFVDWFSGMVCRAGGPLRSATGSLFLGHYFEGSQPPVQNGGDALMIGGSWGGQILGGGTINATGNQVVINALRMTGGGISIDDDVGGTLSIGRNSSGGAALLRATAASPYLALCGPDASQNVNVYSDQVHLLQFSGGGYFATTANFAPLVDNTNDLGRVDKRWNDVFATNAVIQTSDLQHKSHIRKLSSKQFSTLLDAVGAVPLIAFKLKSAVKKKGKSARDHYGIGAQDLHDEMVKRGLNPFAGGVLGCDPVSEEIEEEVEVEREAMRAEFQYEDQIEIVDGKAIRHQVLVERPVPDFYEVPVHDEDGNPIIIPARAPHKRMALVDGEIKEIEVPGSPARPMMHRVRRMERVKEKLLVSRPKLKDGEPEMIWNVRYDEFWALRQAWLEREMRKPGGVMTIERE
jgi:hypothetical protein